MTATATAPDQTTRTKTVSEETGLAQVCDAACPASAKVVVTFATGELHLCGHHYRANELEIALVSLNVDDKSGWVDAVIPDDSKPFFIDDTPDSK